MCDATQSPCDPSALAAAVRTLARDAHVALKGPHTSGSLAGLVRRAEALKVCVTGPLGPWLNGLVEVLGLGESEECASGHLPYRRNVGSVPPINTREVSPGHLSGRGRESA